MPMYEYFANFVWYQTSLSPNFLNANYIIISELKTNWFWSIIIDFHTLPAGPIPLYPAGNLVGSKKSLLKNCWNYCVAASPNWGGRGGTELRAGRPMKPRALHPILQSERGWKMLTNETEGASRRWPMVCTRAGQRGRAWIMGQYEQEGYNNYFYRELQKKCADVERNKSKRFVQKYKTGKDEKFW